MSEAAAQPEALERRPAILAVDDEPAVLAAVARDLRRGFGSATACCARRPAARRWTACASCAHAATTLPC